jgi:hypothetical protein
MISLSSLMGVRPNHDFAQLDRPATTPLVHFLWWKVKS